MATWKDRHPSWEYRLWTSEKEKAPGVPWRLQSQIDRMSELNGKADLMRYELLLDHGGICVDADSECAHPLDESFLEPDCWSAWENEIHIPGMIATGYIGASKGCALVADVIDTIEKRSTAGDWHRQAAWRIVGPLIWTEVARRHPELRTYPAGAFLPEHYSGVAPAPYDGPVYARQFWGSTIVSKHYRYKGLT
jgi:mannosyltransferase OCH1-like enzyme